MDPFLARGQQVAVAGIRTRVETFVRATWGSMGSWREQDIARMVNNIMPTVTSAKMQVAEITDVYLSQILEQKRLGVEKRIIESVRPVPAKDVYARAGKTVWTELGKGKSLEAATSAGLDRLMSLITTDIQLASRAQAHEVFKSSNIAGYRRTLTGAENCALCVLASTQRYHKGELMPIHPGCDCGVAPIIGSQDPGWVLNRDLVEHLHENVAGFTGVEDVDSLRSGRDPDYRKIKIRTHGEYGPTLTWRDQKFTGPFDLAA